MPSFAYTAIDASGNRVTGSLSVRNKSEAYRELESRSLAPVKVIDSGQGSGGKTAEKAKSGGRSGPVRLGRTQLILFTEELADLLDAGLQLEQALRILEERQQIRAIRAVSETLRTEIREGTSFSKALKIASPSFDELYRNLVLAGEASGSLSEILRRLAVNLKQIFDLQRRTVSAMIYPATVLLGCVVLLFVFSTVLMPQLTEMIRKTGQELPLVTDLLIRFTDFIGAWWWLILVIVVAVAILFRAIITTSAGRAWWDRYKLRAFAVGPVIVGRFYAQFCHTMANLVNNGVPLLNSLKLITRGTANTFLRSRLETVVADVGEGTSLARAMAKTEAFPVALVDRVAIGEQTGELGKSFAKAAAKYDEELDTRIGRLTSVVPTMMLVFVALIVGVVAYSIITTIFGSMSNIRER